MVDPSPAFSLATLFMIGLAGSSHCIGMCGGIATGLGFAGRGAGGVSLVLAYNLGRIASYAVAGALVAGLGYWGSSYLSLAPVLRAVAGVILILMALYLAGWWPVLVHLEKAGARVWQYIRPLGARFMPVTGAGQALALGMVWGWLPCGLVYTALAYAAAQGHPLDGALAMAAFGLGTAPAMVAGGVFSRSLVRFVQARAVRVVMAVVMLAVGLWTLYAVASHLQPGSAQHAGGHHHSHRGEVPETLISIS